MADDVEMTPITPEEGGSVPPKVAPFGMAASPAPAEAPAAAPAAGDATIKLKPVIRKPMIRKPVIGGPKPTIGAPKPAPAAAPAAAEPKKATQNLKSVTGPIPAQATLKKTGIVAEGIITPAQQQAAKSKTSRISLESAIGVAPAKEGPAPLKTIRLRRPTDLKAPSPAPLAPVAPAPVSAPAGAPEAPVADLEPIAAPAETAAAAADDATVTQKKTLKLHRPGVGIKRPSIGAQKDDAAAPADLAGAASGDVAEIKPLAPMDFGDLAPVSGGGSGVPSWVAALSVVVSLAALIVAGAVMFYLWKEGVATDGAPAGANEMQFIQM